MMENRNELEIQATPEEVWDVLTDMGKHAEWNPLIYRAEGKIEVGHKVHLSARTASMDRNFGCLVVRVVPDREFQWNWHIGFPFLMKGEHVFRIESINEESVRFINSEIFKGVLVPLWRKDLATNAKDAMVAMDKALKDRVERLRQAWIFFSFPVCAETHQTWGMRPPSPCC